MKPRSVRFQSAKIDQGVVFQTIGAILNIRLQKLIAFPAWRCGRAPSLSGAANNGREGLVLYVEAITGERFPQLLPRPTRTEGDLDLGEEFVDRRRLSVGRGTKNFLQGCAAAI